MTNDVEMEEVQAPSNSVSSATASSTLRNMKVIASLIEIGAYAKEVRRIVWAVRLTLMLRRKLREPVVYAFLSYALAPGSEAYTRLSSDLPKVLIGCDGVNSVVAKWLGLKKPSLSGRSASRGFAEFPNGHGFKPLISEYFVEGSDEVWYHAAREALPLLKLANVPKEAIQVIEKSESSDMISFPLRYRCAFHSLWGNIRKGNACIAGDALHPMIPDLGQGGCATLEDGVVLARCLGEALLDETDDEEVENNTIKEALQKYAKERRWGRSELIAVAYILGYVQQSNNVVISFLRDKFYI